MTCDINTVKLKEELSLILQELDNILKSDDPDISNWKSTLENKYKYLSKSSETLFKYILNNYGTNKFDKLFFDKTIQLMLVNIENIQNSKTSQYDASANVGTHLANEFIPHLRQNQN